MNYSAIKFDKSVKQDMKVKEDALVIYLDGLVSQYLVALSQDKPVELLIKKI